jgi:hypothetical protein
MYRECSKKGVPFKMSISIKTGKYIHSKSGKTYEVLGTARHSEDLSELVVYRALYDSKEFGQNSLWVRPKSMFEEVVEIDGEMKPRFLYGGE